MNPMMMMMMMMNFIKCQVFLALRHCTEIKSTNTTSHIHLVFEERGNWITWRKTSRSRVENQQTQPTYDAESGYRTQSTLVGGERCHHCTILDKPSQQDSPMTAIVQHILLHQMNHQSSWEVLSVLSHNQENW